MKILVVCQHFYPEEFRVNDICFELFKMGHKVTVLTGLPNYPLGKVFKEYKWFKKRKENLFGVEVLRSPIVGRGNNNISIAINYAVFALTSCIKAIFMKKDFDIVLSYQLSPISMVWPGIIVSKMHKIPLVIYSFDLWPASMLLGGIKKDTWQYKLFYNMSKKTYDKAENIFVSSKEYISYFEKELQLKNKNYTYIPNYAEDDYKGINKKENSIFDILFAGNIGPAQDVESIVDLAAYLKNEKDILFHIVGDGLSKTKCEELAKEKKLKNIKFYGRHSSKEMKKFYEIADAFIITLKDNEVVNRCEPSKLQSYMIASKPIFGMINGVVNKIINENNCGVAAPAGEYKLLGNEILKNYKQKQKLVEWGKSSVNYYNKNYKKEVNLKLLESKLNDIVGLKNK